MTDTPAKKQSSGTVRIVLGSIGLAIALLYLLRTVAISGGDSASTFGSLTGMVVFVTVGVVLLLAGLRARKIHSS